MHLLIFNTRNLSEAQLMQSVIKGPLHSLHEKWHSIIKKTLLHSHNTLPLSK